MGYSIAKNVQSLRIWFAQGKNFPHAKRSQRMNIINIHGCISSGLRAKAIVIIAMVERVAAIAAIRLHPDRFILRLNG
jgi:hypothetical protein